MLTYKL